MKVTNFLTIDFEDWYQGLTSTSKDLGKWPYLEKRLSFGTEWILDVLAQRKIKATFFVLGQAAADHPRLVERMAREGHEIGLHSYRHQRIDKMNKYSFAEDIKKNLDLVVGITKISPKGFRAPCFSVNLDDEWFWAELSKAGIRYDSSIFPIKTTLYGNPHADRNRNVKKTSYGDIIIYPINTIRIMGINLPFSGGFYFRLIPYDIIKKIVKGKNNKGESVIFYFHPWEFDPIHPNPSKLISRERISHYYGLNKTKGKFIRLINDFKFGALGESG